MSRFDNLEKELTEAKSARRIAEEEQRQALVTAGAQSEPLIRRAYAVFGDYFKTILEPRGYKTFPRKKEGLTEEELNDLSRRPPILFAYVTNVISPIEEQPKPKVRIETESWLTSPIQSYPDLWKHLHSDWNRWHPNIALQFAAVSAVKEDVTNSTQGFTRFMPGGVLFIITVWGMHFNRSEKVLPSGISVSTDNAGFNRYGTFIKINPNATELENQITFGLELATPSVIDHKGIFEKSKYAAYDDDYE